MTRSLRRLCLGAAGVVAAACGGPTSSLTSTTGPASAAASPTVAPTPTPAPASDVVWEVRHSSGGGQEIRVVSASGTVRSVTTLSADTQILAAGHGRLVAVDLSSTTLRVIDLGSGAASTLSGGTSVSGESIFGGALSPDGSRFAYVDVVSPTSALERVADLGSHAVTTLRTVTDNMFDAPSVWSSGGIGATTVVGFADAGPQAAQQLDASTMARVHSTSVTGICGVSISDDSTHAADTIHTALGDEADANPGPGPPRPCNSLRSYSIGGTPSMLFSEAHHSINIVAQTGSQICFYDDSAVGGVAGISSSSSFGLFLLRGGSRRQISHWDGGYWATGSFINGQVVAASGPDPAASASSGPAKLVRFDAAGNPTTIDTVADGQPGLVAAA